jgi:hypothetical protein
MTPSRLTICLVAAAGCTTAKENSGPSDMGAAVASLSADAFQRPWALHDQLGPDRPFDALLAIPGGFVAVTHAPTTDAKAFPSRNNIGAFSADGVTWQEVPLGESVHARSLAIGNEVIVAVGQRWGAGTRGSILTSTNGKSWTEQPAPDVGLMSVSFVAGQFWAFGELGAFFTSRDGRSWSDHSRRSYVQLNGIAFGNGRYVIVGNVSWLSSSDGSTWTEHATICDDVALCPGVVPPGGSPPGALALDGVVFGNGVFVTNGWLSHDGLHWTPAPPPAIVEAFTHGVFLGLADLRTAVSASDDGQSWSDRTSFITTDDRDLSCAGRTCLVVGKRLLVIPRPGDPLPLARLPVLQLDDLSNHQTSSARATQPIELWLTTREQGKYATPEISSPAVRFVDSRFGGGPPLPGKGSPQLFRFVAAAPGRAVLHIPYTDGAADYQATIDVSPR